MSYLIHKVNGMA